MYDVLLIGEGSTSHSALQSLSEECRVIALMRSSNGDEDSTAALAHSLSIPLIQDTSIRSIEGTVRDLRPDAVVISSYSRIVRAEVLALSRFVNVHYSLLPRYRGRANVNWAILNGEPMTGISIHRVDPGLDSGNILFQQAVPIGDRATVTDLYETLNGIQRRHLGEAVRRFLDGYEGEVQPATGATYGCTRVPSDGDIDWTQSTVRIDRLIRALQAPFPHAFTFLAGRQVEICAAMPLADPPQFDGRIPGRVVGVYRTSGAVDVLTGDGVLRIAEVQCNGERIPAARVITSTKQTLGLKTSDLLCRIAELETQLKQAASENQEVR